MFTSTIEDLIIGKVNELPPELTELLSSALLRHYPRSQIILYQGDQPSDVFILKTGIIKIHDIDENGNEKILHILKAPAVIPFVFFSNDDQPTKWFYTSLTDCDIYSLAKGELEKLMRENAGVTYYLLTWFSKEVHEVLVRLNSLGKTNVEDKIIAALKFLAVCHTTERPSGWRRVTFPVSHQLIADMVGITRESAAMTMKELQDKNLVRSPRLTILEINFKKLLSAKETNL